MTTTAQGGYNSTQLSYSQLIDADSITVTFDGTEYECPRISVHNGYIYGGFTEGGAPDFSEYPFAIASDSDHGNMFATETAGTYSIKIETEETVATTTPCFDLARGYSCNEYTKTVIDESVTTVRGKEGVTAELQFLYPQGATGFTITFDGVTYNPTQNSDGTYGAYKGDFSEYPFQLLPESYGVKIYTENPGTYSVKIEMPVSNITTTPCFRAAVRSGGSVSVNAEETALQCYRIDLRSSVGAEIPAKSKTSITMSILSTTSEATSINTLHAAWGSINHSLSDVLVVPKSISTQRAYVDVYNFGDSAIILDSNLNYIEAKILSFSKQRAETACVLLGEGCGGGK